jgi:hypothetical protein
MFLFLGFLGFVVLLVILDLMVVFIVNFKKKGTCIGNFVSIYCSWYFDIISRVTTKMVKMLDKIN